MTSVNRSARLYDMSKPAAPSIPYLLVCLMEEAAEVQKECAKALRFGLQTTYKGTTPEGRLKVELNDLAALRTMLIVAGVDIEYDMNEIHAKIARVKDTLDHAQEKGLIKP